MNLNEVAEGDSPFGQVNALSPTDYGRVAMITFVLLSGFAIGRWFFDTVKSSAGAEDFDLGVEGVL